MRIHSWGLAFTVLLDEKPTLPFSLLPLLVCRKWPLAYWGLVYTRHFQSLTLDQLTTWYLNRWRHIVGSPLANQSLSFTKDRMLTSTDHLRGPLPPTPFLAPPFIFFSRPLLECRPWPFCPSCSLSLSLSRITYKKVSLWGKAFWTIWINKRDILCFVSLSTESNPYFLPTIIRARTQDHHALPCVMMPPASIWAQFASKIRVFPLFFHDMNHTHMLCNFKLLQQLCCAHAPFGV